VCLSVSLFVRMQQYKYSYLHCCTTIKTNSYLHCCITIRTVAVSFLRNQLLILRLSSQFSLRNDLCEAILQGLYPEVLFVFEFIYTLYKS
jgi:hypothetical protein